MMQDKQVKVQDLSEQEHQQVVTTSQKEFELNGIRVNYENNYMVSQLEQNFTGKFIVTNYLCFQEGNKIKKYIEVNYGNKKIRIRDQFQFQDPKYQGCESGETPKKEKKVQIVKRPLYIPTERCHKKRDTKNIVKNIIKLFINWLSLQSIELMHMEVKKRALDIIHKMNFNNSMIRAFAEDPLVNPVFSDFIESDAQKFIEASKIRDKDAHVTIIQYYLSILRSKQQLFTNKTSDKVSSQP